MNLMEDKIYRRSVKYAYDHNEMDDFMKSNRISRECADGLTKILENRFDGEKLSSSCIDDAIEKWSEDRICHVVANTVNRAGNDRRYDLHIKEWANSFPKDRDNFWNIDAKPDVINELANFVRMAMTPAF